MNCDKNCPAFIPTELFSGSCRRDYQNNCPYKGD